MKFVFLVLSSFFISSFSNANTSEKELVLYNWEEYMPEEILEAFFQETGYRVRQVYYETDELKDELIYATQGKGLDLVLGSRYSFNQYADRGGVLAQIPPEKFRNIKHIEPRWLESSPKIRSMSSPLLWGTLGIIYRSDLVSKPVTSWMDLFKPEDSLKSKVIMVNDIRDSFAAAHLALNQSINSESPKEITKAGQLLGAQRPYVRAYRYVTLDEKSELVSGSIVMTLGYNGDAMMLKDTLDTVNFVVPEEGTELWADFIGVFQSSEKKEAAFKFIDFINDPERAAFISEELGSASTNKSSEKYMSEEHLSNPLIYPPQKLIDKSEFLKPLSPRTINMYNTIFINVSR